MQWGWSEHCWTISSMNMIQKNSGGKWRTWKDMAKRLKTQAPIQEAPREGGRSIYEFTNNYFPSTFFCPKFWDSRVFPNLKARKMVTSKYCLKSYLYSKCLIILILFKMSHIHIRNERKLLPLPLPFSSWNLLSLYHLSDIYLHGFMSCLLGMNQFICE